MSESRFVYTTYIRATPDELWHALTTAESIQQYWFGMRVESGWNAGSPWAIHSDDGLMDSGEILESVPQKRLVIRWQNEWKPEYKAEGSSRCVYELAPAGGCVRLTVTHSIGRPSSGFIQAVSEGWPLILSNLKSLLETGEVALVDHPGHED